MAFKDIRKSNRRFLTPADIAFLLGVLVLLGGLLAFNLYLSRTFSGGEWLFQRWSAIRAHWAGTVDPYGASIAERVQTLVYGRDAFLNEYPYALNDPLYIVLLYSPLAFFSDFAVARAVWMLFAEAALVAIVLLSLRLAEWRVPGWVMVTALLIGLFNYFSIHAVLSASPAVFLTLLVLLVLLALRAQADELAGILLALMSYQWEVTALVVFVILVLVVANRRWGVLSVLGMALVVMLGVAFLARSGWALSFANAVLYNWNRHIDYSFGTALIFTFPAFQPAYLIWLTLGLGALMLVETIRAVHGQFVHIVWVACLALAVTPLLGFAIFPANHIAFLPALLLVFSLAWERWRDRRSVILFVMAAVVIAISYGLYYLTLISTSRIYADMLRSIPPVLVVLALYWMRWWAVRPPRIWADQIGARR